MQTNRQQFASAWIRFLPSLTDVAFLMPLVFLFVRMNGAQRLLGDGDTGWHIRTGEWILQNGRVPTTDFYSFTKPGQPWYAWEWLWDVVFAWLHQQAGMAAVVLASILVLCLTFALLFREVRRTCPNVLIAFGATWRRPPDPACIGWRARTCLRCCSWWCSGPRWNGRARARPVGCSGCLC